MVVASRIAERFNGLSVLGQSCAIVAAATVGADLLTLIFYAIFFSDRLLLDLVLTSLIVVAVAFPLSYFFMSRSAKLVELAAELDRANRLDDLTALLNRKTFLLQSRQVLSAHDGDDGAGMLLFIDADHFKAINDRHGHAMGDAVLQEIGAALTSSIGEQDIAGRLGGEEFVVLLRGANPDKATLVCERLRRKVKGIAAVVGMSGREVTVSIGVSKHQPRQSLDALLLAADRNLYLAKANGRDRIVNTDGKLAAA
ncbi:diguanylate cyclase (GGDEF)-like protein [Aminobacter aminovorans]|uniref:diguanylate cyclase n=1 Tax=Aminobacter aminovorans TaxID=83263 RepID=A0A380WJB1_AMIAI|nr:GGDEF domain-containing protein [Aminobacter aminovorans]TCS19796.1 diguanylate cyclase (GGDEF)-like protein [Aminobacter aminovorans]SUU89099.1 Probable diguanylate cyclase YdaM [Aminobacter aminovorans]